MDKRILLLLLTGTAGTALGGIPQEEFPEMQKVVDTLLQTKKCVACKLLKVNLAGADFAGANLQGSDLWGARMMKANLAKANLSKADLGFAHLIETNLTGANLSGADLSDAGILDANLQNANLENANLKDASLVGTNLEGANLTKANLDHADFKAANLKNTKLSGAKLNETNCGKATILPTGFACVDKNIQPICNSASDCNKYMPSLCLGRCVYTKGTCAKQWDTDERLSKYIGSVTNEGKRMLKTWDQLCNSDYKDKCQEKCKAYPEGIALSGTKYCWLP
jgi:hypothetical protein